MPGADEKIHIEGVKTLKTRIYLRLLLLIAAQSASAQGFGPAVTIDGVEFSRTKIEAQVDHLINQRGLGSGGITQPQTYRQIQEEVVEQIVVQELLWQEAKRRSFIVSEEEVGSELEKLKGSFDTTLAFQFKIKEGGFTENYRWTWDLEDGGYGRISAAFYNGKLNKKDYKL